eukprot:TRINITY_DN71397_c0_g1_i1.p1 TRINITY_DN71397_c0_g1~~TRINITY_DN71397_c0_g1_i1.p1  ORF type:complete len:360 (+),score=29.01 TRINITY_DN71397_c0_g1_i1:29-1081(+)
MQAMHHMADEFMVTINSALVIPGPASAHFPYHRHVSAPERVVPSTPLVESSGDAIVGELENQHADRADGVEFAEDIKDGVENVREDKFAFENPCSAGVDSHVVDVASENIGAQLASDCAAFAKIDDADAIDVPAEWQNKTTVMVRNVSYKCNLAVLQRTVCEAGFDRAFDYICLPTGGHSSTSKGYAFINFVDAPTAYRFKCVFDSSSMGLARKGMSLNVRPANLQGYQENGTHNPVLHLRRNRQPASRASKPLPETVRAYPPLLESCETPRCCKYCKQFGIKTSDKFCRWCGSSTEQITARPRLEELRCCDNCLTFGDQYQMYCPWCGNALRVCSVLFKRQSAGNEACW